ncbi:MAG: rod shape-determining protein MreC [Firmicutes bacterium HGW-Firmicutes-12]|nr:MAG: rod shape-determining protein MreC [Firmicutes bacterium HGW-Firmicutes-12]
MIIKRWAIISGLVVTGIIIFFFLMKTTGWNNPILFPATNVVRESLAPVQKVIINTKKGVDDILSYFNNNKRLLNENEELKKKLTMLEEKSYALLDLEMENKRLYDLLEYKKEKSNNYEFALAKIIGRDPGNWYKTITINRGSSEGIKKDMAVVTHNGLVGLVINTTANTSEVLLIIDTESAVGARILENRVTPGIAVGTGKSDYLQMIHLPHDAPLEIGQTIVSSGLGELYPEGIRIGNVAEVTLEPNGLIKTALLEPLVDFSRLEEVFVILQTKKNETELPSTSEGNSAEEQEEELLL